MKVVIPKDFSYDVVGGEGQHRSVSLKLSGRHIMWFTTLHGAQYYVEQHGDNLAAEHYGEVVTAKQYAERHGMSHSGARARLERMVEKGHAYAKRDVRQSINKPRWQSQRPTSTRVTEYTLHPMSED